MLPGGRSADPVPLPDDSGMEGVHGATLEFGLWRTMSTARPTVNDTNAQRKSSWWRSALVRVYRALTVKDSVQPVDMIFVIAGRMDRKPYGLELYRAGVAQRLVLSIGRFEVSKMSQIEFTHAEELIALRSRTSPDERHFFVHRDPAGIRIETIALPRWSTYGEALGLRDYLEGKRVGKIIVVSTDIHLRRVAYTFGKVFAKQALEFRYCPAPQHGSLREDAWWTRAESRHYVIQELIKLVGYRLILPLPTGVRRRLMKLKQ